MKFILALSSTDPALKGYESALLKMIQTMDKREATYWKKSANLDILTEEMKCSSLSERWVDNTNILILLVKDSPIGFVEFTSTVGNSGARWLSICYLYVNRTYRGLGYGSALVDQVRNFAKIQQVDQLSLSVHASNKRANKFYKKYGFKEQTKYFTIKP
ncbi:putative glucosamine 6-phosphate N-acetyltransferase 2 [Serratia phage vB_SmaS-Totoro]|nr:putative glucosamine 6-phosphate N-acetyltransferase 2 [Serratia phage vB_SmaS-Totoro]